MFTNLLSGLEQNCEAKPSDCDAIHVMSNNVYTLQTGDRCRSLSEGI